jgi:NADPH:quinone reductase-like Zn-dependent oxidoreductase
LELVRSIGADHVIDYTREDFTRGAQRYDVIIDNVGTHSRSDYRRVLTRSGSLVMVGGPSDGPWIGGFSRSIEAMLVQPFVSQRLISFLAHLDRADLAVLGDMMQSGQLTPVIDRRYPLSATADAIRYLEQGHARGKVIVSVD